VGAALAGRGDLDRAARRERGSLNRHLPPRTLARLAALYLCWGTSIPALKLIVETVPPLGGAAAVFLLGGGGVLALAAVRRQRPTASQLRRAAATGVLLLGGQGLATVALTEVSASLTAILIASNALWAAIFSRFAGGPLDGTTMLQLAVGFGGGVLLALAIAFGEMAPAAWDAASAGSLAAAAFLLLFDSLAGFLLYTSLVRGTPLPVVATYAYVTPVIAGLIGVLILDEPLSSLTALGATVALLAVGAQLRARPATAPA
jgi:drug/metabolite transporter (DMT)-like permease